MPARQEGQPLRRQSRHPWRRGRRRERQEGTRRRVATVDMNLEFTLWRARVADANLGRIGTAFKIEGQGGDGANNTRSARQVDSAIDPAWVHDVDGERQIGSGHARSFATTTRFKQESD